MNTIQRYGIPVIEISAALQPSLNNELNSIQLKLMAFLIGWKARFSVRDKLTANYSKLKPIIRLKKVVLTAIHVCIQRK